MPDVRNSTPPKPVPVRITLEVAGPLTRAQIVERARQAFGKTAVLVTSGAARPAQSAPAPVTEDDPFAALERLSRRLKANSVGRPTTPDEIEALVHQVRAERRAAAASAE